MCAMRGGGSMTNTRKGDGEGIRYDNILTTAWCSCHNKPEIREFPACLYCREGHTMCFRVIVIFILSSA